MVVTLPPPNYEEHGDISQWISISHPWEDTELREMFKRMEHLPLIFIKVEGSTHIWEEVRAFLYLSLPSNQRVSHGPCSW